MSKISISLVVNTLNAEEFLGECLQSCAWCDESIVVDMHSSDNTRAIAKAAGAKVFLTDPQGYVEPARNYALSLASSDWILLLDADECVEGSRANIEELITSLSIEYAAVRLRRVNWIGNTKIIDSGWGDDPQIRLFRKGKVRWKDQIHSHPDVDGLVKTYDSKCPVWINHRNFNNLNHFHEKLSKYALFEQEPENLDDFRKAIVELIDTFKARYTPSKDGALSLVFAASLAHYRLAVRAYHWERSKKYPKVPIQFESFSDLCRLADGDSSSPTYLIKEVDRLTKEIESLKKSSSWKITQPLRACVTSARAVRKILKQGILLTTNLLAPELFRGRLRQLKLVYRQRGIKGLTRTANRFLRSRIAQQNIRNLEWAQVTETTEIANVESGLPHCESPRASIIISAYNNIAFTSNCVKSLVDSMPLIPYEVIIADDGSDDTTREWCASVANIRHIITGNKQGFVLNNNEAAKFAKGEFLVFLNNDTVVQPGWLDSLAHTFDRQSNVGLVGSQLIHGNGALQEAGGIVWRDGSAWNFGRNEDPGKPEFNYTRDVDYCSAAAIMIPKAVFEALGGFDPLFAPAYYEDTDLAFRVRQLGMRVVYQPKARVVHFEGKSNGTSLTEGLKRYQEANAGKFRERWKRSLESHQLNGESLDKAKDRSKSNRVLFLDQCTPTPDRDSGSIDALNITLMLREMGFQVTFAPVSNFLHCGAYTEDLQSEGIEVLYSPFVTSLRAHLKSCNNRYDLIFACRYNTLQGYYKDLKKYCKTAKLLFHTVDLHYLRLQREADLFQNKKLSAFAKQTKTVELDLIRKSDVATVVSQAECDLLRESVQPFNVHTLPYTRNIPGARTSYRDREGIVFVGSYLHPPNIDAVLFFAKEVLPLVHTKLPDVVFHIVGADPPEEVRALEGRRVKVMGHVKDLDSLMNSMRASVAPLRFGAGIKGKVGQSLAYGVPVVATPLAAEGMGLTDRKEILLAEEALEMAELLCAVYSSEKLWERLSQQGIEAASTRFGINTGYTNLAKILSELGFQNIPATPPSNDLRLRG